MEKAATARFLLAGLIAWAASTAHAAPPPVVPALPDAALPGPVVPVSGDCNAVGARQAAQLGGQLARATPEIRNGQPVCVVVVLMPARDGGRPSRREIVVPRN